MRPKHVGILLIAFIFLMVLSGCGGRLGLPGLESAGTAREYIDRGWKEFDNGNYSSACENFEMALERQPTPKEKAEANTGIGWCKAKRYGIKSGLVYFEKGKEYFDDAKIGLAGAYLSSGNKSDYQKGVELLESMGLSSTDYVYKAEHNIGVSNAEAHALLGILYYYTGNEGAAEAQIIKAKEIDDNLSSAVDQIATQFLSTH